MLSKVKIVGAASLLALSIGAQANVIDLYTTAQIVSTSGQAVNSVVSSQVGGAGDTSIIGGFRDLIIKETVDGTGGGTSIATMESFNGSLTFASAPTVTAVGNLQWDGDDSGSIETLDKTGMGAENLVIQTGCPTGGCDRFIFDVLSSDFDFDFTIGIYTDDDNWTEFDLEATQGAHVSEIFFSFFENSATCGAINISPGVLAQRCGGVGGNQVADTTSVGAIQLVFNIGALGTTDLDFKIGAVTKTGVPEPSMVALLGLGLASSGLVSIRRRRKEKALLAA